MNKAYNKITWQNKPSTATPLNQTNLNEMSNALDTIDDRVIALDSGKVGSVTVTNTLPTGDTIATITVDGTATNIKSAQVVVDAEPSATSANPLQNKAIYEMLNNLLPEETVQGNPIAISDASGLNAKACSVDLLPIQDLHGYDSPWVGGAGKNKIDVSGQTQSSGFRIIPTQTPWNFPYNTTYTFSCKLNALNNGAVQLTYRENGANKNVIQSIVSGNNNISLTFTPQSTTDIWTVYCNVGGTVSDIQLEIGSTATNFAPYENICPISGRTEVSVKRTGKNLLPITATTATVNGVTFTVLKDSDNKIIEINADGTASANGYFIINSSITLKAGTYAINGCPSGGSGSSYYLYFYNSASSDFGNGSTATFNSETTITNTRIVFSSGQVFSNKKFYPMIRLASITDDTYEPYQGETVTVSFGQTVYGGTLDVTNGKLTIDRAIVTYTGASGENWTKQSGGVYAYYISKDDFVKSLEYTTDLIRCDKLQTVERHNTMTNTPCSISGYRDALSSYPNNNWIYVYIDDTITSVELFKTWISNNNIQISYKLATPIEIILTAEQISLLKGNNVVFSDSNGNIKLTYSADIKAFIENQLSNS